MHRKADCKPEHTEMEFPINLDPEVYTALLNLPIGTVRRSAILQRLRTGVSIHRLEEAPNGPVTTDSPPSQRDGCPKARNDTERGDDPVGTGDRLQSRSDSLDTGVQNRTAATADMRLVTAAQE